MKIKAAAKINLALNVVSKREDGYHELEMIMAPLDFYDDIEIHLSDEDLVRVIGDTIPLENTMTKAIDLMKRTYGLKECFEVIATKRIPSRAGLAGGSADAAAVMRAINKLCDINASLEELATLGLKIGADVPFCIYEQASIVKGIGEQITPIHMNCPFEVLLVKPKAGVSTPEAFKTLHLDYCDHTNVDTLKDALESNAYEEAITYMKNSLEESALRLVPEIQVIKQKLMDMGFDHALMSGSGSTVFGLTRDPRLIERAKDELSYDFLYHTHIV